MFKKPTIITISIILTFLLIIFTIVIIKYNKAQSLKHDVDENYSTISLAIENRLDKFTELLSALNNAESHVERQLSKITEARKSLANKESLNDITTNMELIINETIILLEDNPNTYIVTSLYNNYMAEISATINMITNTKLTYNNSITKYNLYLSKFPNNIILRLFNFNEKELYNPNLI